MHKEPLAVGDAGITVSALSCDVVTTNRKVISTSWTTNSFSFNTHNNFQRVIGTHTYTNRRTNSSPVAGTYVLVHTHTISVRSMACCVYSLHPVRCRASGPGLAALPNKLLAVHSVLNAEAL